MKRRLESPVASFCEHRCKCFQSFSILLVKAMFDSTVDVNNCHDLSLRVRLKIELLHSKGRHRHYLAIPDDRHNDLALGISVTCDMSRELVDVRDELRLAALGGCSAYSSTKRNCLASDLDERQAMMLLPFLSSWCQRDTLPWNGPRIN